MAKDVIVRVIGDTSSFQRSMRTAESETLGFQSATAKMEKDLSKSLRGVASGSGLFKSLGRSVAFASGGFLAFAGVTDIIKQSINAATEDAAAQRQLAAQFRANKQDLSQYSAQIKDASLNVSELSGFTETDLTQAFTSAFRATDNVSKALYIQALAANVARARNISLAQATLTLDKAFGGSASSLRRIGIEVPKNLKGMAALEYVNARVAGQAKAGTTAQQRFAAALHNTEITIGAALLPVLDHYLNKATKWLDNSQNQKRVQHDVTTGAKILGGTISVLSDTFHVLTSRLNPSVDAFWALKGAIKAVKTEISSYNGAVLRPVTGEDVRLRTAVGTIAGTHVPLPSAAGSANRPRASLDYQISLATLNVARAQGTRSTVDDRASLVRLAALTREKLNDTKDLAKRITLTQQLSSLENQIQAIDDQNLANQKTADKKKLDAKKKEAELAKKHAEAMAAAEAKVQSAIQSLQSKFQSSLQSVQSAIGQLFSGPLINPTTAQFQSSLGVPAFNDPNLLLRDLRAQTTQFARLQRDLTRFRRLGASKALISELSQQGTDAIPQIEALLSKPGIARQFIRSFNQRERLALRTARMDVNAAGPVVIHAKDAPTFEITVNLDGKVVAKEVTKHQQKEAKRTAPQRGSRHPGVGARG